MSAPSPLQALCTCLAIAWASPCTAVGLLAGLLGLLSGGHVRRRGRTLEFWGGIVSWFLRRIPGLGAVSAMTVGHVILGESDDSLDYSRAHEWIHVRQYERWGIFFFPAYFGCMLWLFARGQHPYYDNPFEVEAYRATRRIGSDLVDP